MIHLKETHVYYQMIGEGCTEELMAMLHVLMFVDEIDNQVGVEVGISADNFWRYHVEGKKDEIADVFDHRFKKALVAFIKKKHLNMAIITDYLLQEVRSSMQQSIDRFIKKCEK